MKKFSNSIRKKYLKIAAILILLVFAAGYFFALPGNLFPDDYATVINDRNNHLLSATLASDEQWRFPPMDTVPGKFEKAILNFEDRYFYYHPGFNPMALLRAIWLNLKHGEVKSGGSTLSMQVIRLSRKDKPRTYWEKIKEIILASRLELNFNKKEILAMYASHAPFGGNVVGLPAAAWKYYGRQPDQLSWGEASLLAVLPNSPGLIYPGRNQELLLQKRDRLLQMLVQRSVIDSTTAALAKMEPLPGRYEIPQHAAHLLNRAQKEGHQQEVINTTLDYNLQVHLERMAGHFYRQNLKENKIKNLSILVSRVQSGEVLAYVGNNPALAPGKDGSQVDVVNAPRSTGSILKPFLYAAMLHEGALLPKTLTPDIPTIIDGFSPKNFTDAYDGAVPANQALARSLNVPAVLMLKDFGYIKFHHYLQQLGLTTLDKPAEHYGLSLILGGAEGSLWEICGAYASLSRILQNYFQLPEPKRYQMQDVRPLQYTFNSQKNYSPTSQQVLSASSIHYTLKAMLDVNRPPEESSWKLFSSANKIAWKTGTSIGFRDAWAIGVTPEYVVGVWVGNADGEGRPGIVGVEAAAPLLFQVFDFLDPSRQWFQVPFSDMKLTPVCARSGHKAGLICHPVDTSWIPAAGLRSRACPYHTIVHLDKQEKFRVNSDCEPVSQMIQKSWFVLPVVQEYYYRRKNAFYKTLPPFRQDCHPATASSIQMIYPKPGSKIYVPKELDGKRGRTVFEASHRQSGQTLFWHLDNQFIGETRQKHQMALFPTEGDHLLTLTDVMGEQLQVNFTIISKD